MMISASSHVMLYISAQNELSDKADQSVAEIRRCVKLDDLSTYILLDRINADPTFHTTRYQLPPGVDDKQFGKAEEDLGMNKEMTDPAVFNNHLRFAREHFAKTPAEALKQRVLFLWGHGGGMVMLDEQQANGVARSQASIRDFAKVLVKTAEGRRSLEFDIVAFDACYMAMIETMLELRDCTRFALCSSTMVDADSFPYETIFSKMKADGKNLNPALLADAIAELYRQRYIRKYPDGSRFLFVCNMDNIELAAKRLNGFGAQLSILLGRANTAGPLRQALVEALIASGASFKDVFVLRFIKLIQLRLRDRISGQDLKPLQEAAAALDEAVRGAFAGNLGDSASKPISPMVFAPQNAGTYRSMAAAYNALDSSEGGAGGWTRFWQDYHGEAAVPPAPPGTAPVDTLGIPENVTLA
jgi:Clostripain family